MTDAGHTETPWRVFTTPDGRKIVGVGDKDGQGILDRGFGVWAWNDAEGIANAELVVRAVNSHDDLVTALKEMRDAAVYLCAAQAENKLTEAADARFKKALETTRAALNKATEGR